MLWPGKSLPAAFAFLEIISINLGLRPTKQKPQTMKNFLLAVVLMGLYHAQAQVLLFDQTNNPTGATAAQDFETVNDLYDCKGADDFVVPSGQTWYIDSVILYGQYSAGAQLNSGVIVSFYDNSSGLPGTLVATETAASNADPDGNGSLIMHFSTPVVLTPGTYWLVGCARKDFGSGGGQWYWGRNSTGSGNNFLWQNPLNGFGTGCTSWIAASSCSALGVTDPGLRFKVWGCYGPKPSLELGSDDTILCSNEVPWTLEPDSLFSGLVYFWNTGDTANSLNIDSAGLYVMYAYDPVTQCAARDEMNIDIATNPVANIASDTICEGDFKQFNGFSGCGLCTHIWNGTDTSFFYTTDVQGWHYLEIIDPASGCAGTDSAWLEIQSTDPPVLVPGTEIDLCVGDTVYISTAESYVSYAWSTGVFTPGIYVTAGGEYAVTVETSAGCATTDTAVVTERPLPQPSITVDTTSTWKIRLTATSGYQSYLWSTGGDDVDIIANSTGNYSVTVTDEFGCEGTKTIFVFVTGIEDLVAQKMRFFPNPAQGYVNISWPAEWVGAASMQVVDISGRPVRTIEALQAQQRVELSNLATGYYLIKIHSPEGEGIARLIVDND